MVFFILSAVRRTPSHRNPSASQRLCVTHSARQAASSSAGSGGTTVTRETSPRVLW